MKLLYAIQGTGNGHLARAMELAPYLLKHAEVDFLISGRAAELKFPFEFKYNYHGLYFIFGKRGGVDYWSSIKSLRPFRLIKDVIQCPVKQYDAIVNDFEPISAWSAYFKNCKTIGVSHQASFFSDRVPLPKRRNHLFEFAMKRFAPVGHRVGTHYKAYDKDIFLPIIRSELLDAQPYQGDKIVVYLPAFSDDFLIQHFNKVTGQQWQIYSKKTSAAYVKGNVEVFPVDRVKYGKALIGARAVVIGSGFQGTSEALYLGKKILTIPMFDQYEQLCNAAALEEMGVEVCFKIDDSFVGRLQRWLDSENACEYRFEPNPEAMANRIVSLVKP